MKRLEHRIPPPLVFLVVAAAMWGIAKIGPRIDIADSARFPVAAALACLAGIFGIPALFSFRRAGTTIDPVRIESASSLVVGGIYRWSRNPMYTGLALLLAAWAAWLASPWALPAPALFVLYLLRFQILPEERALRAKFGAAYERYAKEVRRWL